MKPSTAFTLLLFLATTPLMSQPSADLELGASSQPPGASVIAGQVITYIFTATNNGPDSATDVEIFEPTPGGTIYMGAAPSTGGSCVAVPVGVGYNAEITCTWAGTTAAGVVRSVTVQVRVCSEVGCSTDIVNDEATTSSATFDPLPGNNLQVGYMGGGLGMIAAVETPVLSQSQLDISKSDSGVSSPGGLVTYSIDVANLGPSNAEISFTDTLPTGWIVESADPGFFTFPACTGIGTGTASCTLYLSGTAPCPPLPDTTTVSVVARVPAGATPGFYTNSASIVSGNCLPDTGTLFDTFVSEVANAIFIDGFESGDTTAWSITIQ
jgi:uncharacterized repeat protein (TIGR01451 family)